MYKTFVFTALPFSNPCEGIWQLVSLILFYLEIKRRQNIMVLAVKNKSVGQLNMSYKILFSLAKFYEFQEHFNNLSVQCQTDFEKLLGNS